MADTSGFDPFSLANTALNGAFNIWSVSKANKTNQAIANQTNQMTWDINAMNNQWNKDVALEMFDLENAYNSPQQVRQRLEDAGINPRVAMANGQAAQFASGDVATPTAQTPSAFQMAQVSPIPSPFGNVFGELLQAAKIKTELANAKNLGAQTNRMETLLDKEAENLDLKNEFQQITNDILAVNGHFKAKAEILEKIGNYYQLLSASDLNKASTELRRIERIIKTEEYSWLPEMLGQQLRNLQADEYVKKSQQRANEASAVASIASAGESRARTALTQEQEYQLMEMRDANIHLANLIKAGKMLDVAKEVATIDSQIKILKNKGLASDAELEEVRANAEKAKKENSVFWLRETLRSLEQVNNGITSWIPFAPSKTTTNTSLDTPWGSSSTTIVSRGFRK